MKRCYVARPVMAVVVAGICMAAFVGCSQEPSQDRAPTAKDMRADQSKMNADQRKMMEEGMKRDAERMKGAAPASTGSTQ